MNRSPRSEAPPLGIGRMWVVTGRVQGVGFRPFVYNLAVRCGLRGWVRNDVGRVTIHGEGSEADLERFERALIAEAPPLSRPAIQSRDSAEPEGLRGFAIRASLEDAEPRIHVPPDYFACDDCLREMRDPSDRRFGYPFINCTQCGPRYTLIVGMPYDRPNTTMAAFPLCPACRAEYGDPANRRFHAQPVACPECGPRLRWKRNEREPGDRNGNGDGNQTAHAPAEPANPGALDAHCNDVGLRAAVEALRAGAVIAVKGIGGYHLLCDARNPAAVERLRERKPRPHKPLAVMFADRRDVREHLAPAAVHEASLLDPMRPIVLVPKRTADHPEAGPSPGLAPQIAPGLREVGAFLPYSPLHALLLESFGGPVVATSANVSGEPVLIDDATVEQRLGRVADGFLHHDRPIQRPADDPVLRVIAGEARSIRLGRGCAPLERALPFSLPAPILAVGGHMKNTVALAWENRVVISPHIGDLDAPRSLEVFTRVIAELQALYRVPAARVIHDAHPRYAGTRWALGQQLPVTAVMHHHAHASAVAGEYPGEARWIAFTWDGVGYGADGTAWGGEVFSGRPGAWTRAGTLRCFRLPGGERAGREPWRSAAAICWETGRALPAEVATAAGTPQALALLREAWEKDLNAPRTTAAGRLFDAAAALVGVCAHASFEGQGPMLLEALAEEVGGAALDPWPMPLVEGGDGAPDVLDWEPCLRGLVEDAGSPAERAARFHATLVGGLVAQAEAIRARTGIEAVGLSGGVFQNRILAEAVIARLGARGFRAYLPREIPANDGGLCFGQVVEAAAAPAGVDPAGLSGKEPGRRADSEPRKPGAPGDASWTIA